MTVTIHADHPAELVGLIQDLRTLDGGSARHVRRAVHGAGAIVDEELALLWLTLRLAPSPEFLESLIRADPALMDVVGRRASDEALQELARYQAESEQTPADTETELRALPPAKKANRTVWEQWAIRAGLVEAEQAAAMTRTQLQELATETVQPGQSAPDNTKEG